MNIFYVIGFFSIIAISCKDSENIQNETGLNDKNNLVSSNPDFHHKTNDYFSIDFSTNDNEISIDEAIDSVIALKINSDKLISFQTSPFSRIVEKSDLYFGVPYELDRLLVIDKKGDIITTIKAGLRNAESPYRIGFFDIDAKNNLIYILDEVKSKIFAYNFNGDLKSSFDIPDVENWYYKLFVMDEDNLVLQTKGKPSKEIGQRDSTMVGSTLNLRNKKMTPLYIHGGSPTRDMLLGLGFYQSNMDLLFNYNMSGFLYKYKDERLLVLSKINSPQFVSDVEVNEMDEIFYTNTSSILEKIRNDGKFFDIRNVYKNKDIYFLLYGYKSKFYWLFYNKKTSKYKILSLDFREIEAANGKPVTHLVKNGSGNSFLVFVDGEALQNNKKFKETYDPNSTYLLKIYPKYLNQSAWQ